MPLGIGEDARWLPAAGIGALLLVVPMLLCVGLRGDDDDDGHEGPRRSDRASIHDDGDLDEQAPRDDEADAVVDDRSEEDGVEELDGPVFGERELFGVVRDADGEPVPGAEVMRQGGSRYDETNEEGRYELGSLPAAELVLTVRAKGYRLAELTVPDGVADARERVDVTLEDGARPGGVVVDPEGHPVRDAEVSCEDGDDQKTESDAYGRFELGEDAVGCPARATQGSYGASAQVTLVAGPGNRLALTTPGAIEGVVVDPQGHPVTTFLVAIVSYTDAEGHPGKATYRQTFSHPRGRFTIGRLGAGRYELEVARRGAQVRTKAIEVEPGGEAAKVRVVME